jgi:hypothetical protein
MMQKLVLAVGTAVIIGMTYGALSLNADGKVRVCHREGNGKAHVIEISENALKAHLNHGDSQGAAAGLKPGDACQLVVLK